MASMRSSFRRRAATDRAGDLGHLERVGQAGAVVVAGGGDKDLGLVHQPAEALGVEDAIAVALKRGPQVALWFWPRRVCVAARRAGSRENLRLRALPASRIAVSRSVRTYPGALMRES